MKFYLGVNECAFCHGVIYDLNGYAINPCGHGYGLNLTEEYKFDLPENMLERSPSEEKQG